MRFGEMERDCMLSHGATNILLERLLKVSDDFFAYFCCHCGLMATVSQKNKTYYCKMCNKNDKVKFLNIPYSCKQLIQELWAVHIKLRLGIEDMNRG